MEPEVPRPEDFVVYVSELRVQLERRIEDYTEGLTPAAAQVVVLATAGEILAQRVLRGWPKDAPAPTIAALVEACKTLPWDVFAAPVLAQGGGT